MVGFRPQSPPSAHLNHTHKGGKTAGVTSHNKNIFFVIYYPSGSSGMFALNHKRLLHSFYMFQGKMSFRLRKDSKKLFSVQKVLLRENNFFAPKILQGVSSVCLVYSVKGLNSSLHYRCSVPGPWRLHRGGLPCLDC